MLLVMVLVGIERKVSEENERRMKMKKRVMLKLWRERARGRLTWK
jgi:hypothetical protein